MSGLHDQQRLIAILRRQLHVQVIETHISWILLAGKFAYKIKKAVDLGFLDYTKLAARKQYCAEEIRLNRRTAPELYLDVVALGGTPDAPVFGGEPAFEYAVRMRRFAPDELFDRLLARDELSPCHIRYMAHPQPFKRSCARILSRCGLC